MRQITSHKINSANEGLTVEAVGEPGVDGACQRYRIHNGQLQQRNPDAFNVCELRFQTGPIAEVGMDGLTDLALLAVLEDRMSGRENIGGGDPLNYEALESVRIAIEALGDLSRRTAAPQPTALEEHPHTEAGLPTVSQLTGLVLPPADTPPPEGSPTA